MKMNEANVYTYESLKYGYVLNSFAVNPSIKSNIYVHMESNEPLTANGWRLPHWRYKSRKDFFSNQAKIIQNENYQ
jgi:hypothetical protein